MIFEITHKVHPTPVRNWVSFGALDYFDNIFAYWMWASISWSFSIADKQMIDSPLYDNGEWWYNMVSFSDHFRFFNEYQGILRNIYFKLSWSIMYFKYHSNWKEVYVANSPPLFETLNAVYSSVSNTWSRLESLLLPFRLSDYKTRQFPTNVILRAKDLVHCLGIYHDKPVMPIIHKHRVSYNQLCLAITEFPRIKLKNPRLFTIFQTRKTFILH